MYILYQINSEIQKHGERGERENNEARGIGERQEKDKVCPSYT